MSDKIVAIIVKRYKLPDLLVGFISSNSNLGLET